MPSSCFASVRESTRDVRAHRVRDLHRHVAEAAHADHRDALAGPGAPVAQRRVGRDAGAQQRSGGVERDAVGDAQDVVLVRDDLRAVAAVGVGSVVRAAVVGRDVALQAELLLAGEAVLALAARVDEAPDADAVADRVLRDLRADLAARCRRSRGRAPSGRSRGPIPRAPGGCRSGRSRRTRCRSARRAGRHRGARRCRARRPDRRSGRGGRGS